ncbi:DUF4870 domain-containing protein [Hazenella coriacea]|uniref:Tic20 family protein n=1 Tax=Hazenella coriacea TaxID=1179467 RepID=A0A4R3L7J3_9BACL|nr:DUF4870 domain-containing protein [Hazenella coriacea]TCS94930.1 hypothetical protein EDD58_103355 [Hazenella coriacea]
MEHSFVSNEEKFFAILCHASLILAAPILLPVIFYILKKDSTFIREHAKEALLFNIVVVIAIVIASILSAAVIGLILLPIVAIFAIICQIIAISKAKDGQMYQYPITSDWTKKF